MILIDFVPKNDEKLYLQVFLKEGKFMRKKKVVRYFK